MSAITTRRVVEEVLHVSMDGRAHNLEQARVLARLETPECDSAMERVRALRDQPVYGEPGVYVVTDDQIDEIERDLWHAIESNGREGQCERTIAGNAERLARDAKAITPSLKPADVRRLLRPFLDVLVLGSKADPMEYARAHGDLRRAIRQIPVETLLSTSLANEVGPRKARLLRDMFGGA